MVSEKKYQYSSDWINKLESEIHWRQYWFQLKLIEKYVKKEDRILEIGCGSRFISNYLISRGYSVTTLDIDRNKNPDIVANVVEYNFTDIYDTILAFEIFEHIPFEDFKNVIKKISKSCRNFLIVSVPYNEKVILHLELYIPRVGQKTIHFAIKRGKIIEKHHHWEIGYNVTEKEFYILFESNNFTIVEKRKRWVYNYTVLKKYRS
ncbi:MAG: class I SAM-dependent methyltransferase [Candidatus Marinimicrobia bacterium]|nr:class I SAM-dependent methyltransferase [Candidatus Neomarinimicrobiota bacterium]